MARRESLKKYAKLIQSKGRFGDTELAHINKDEEKLLERYRGGKLSKNPKTGVKEAFPWIAAAYVAGKLISGSSKRKKAVAAAKAKKDAQLKVAEAQKEEALKGIRQAGQMTGEEQQAMSQMRKGAKEGTMDVEGLQQQMSQPLYQQGEAQEATAMGKITQQGLEGSIIAQEVSRKVGSDVRASIADQARSIAYENEKTKADAQRNLQSALMKRGQLLKELALKKGGVMAGYEASKGATMTDYAATRAAQPSDWSILGDTAMSLIPGEKVGQQISSWLEEF